jgi:RimJ/RimL family protein N-acetyltransferase
MTFRRTTDADLIRSVMTHPRVYPHITDDGCPPVEQFAPVLSPAIWYVEAHDGEELLGLWAFVPQNAICWEVHTCLLPNAWGQRGAKAAKEMAAWIWANTDCRRIVTNVPSCNPLAYRFARKAGMVEYGRNTDSFLKDGKLYDQSLLGLSKPEI